MLHHFRGEHRFRQFTHEEEQLRESCAWSKCPVPRGDLHEALYGWVRDLRTLLEDSPEYRHEFDLPLQNAIRELGQYEAVIRNDSVALKRYLAAVVKQHRYVRFAGMAEVSGPDEVEMSRVFVMPRVAEQTGSGAGEASRILWSGPPTVRTARVTLDPLSKAERRPTRRRPRTRGSAQGSAPPFGCGSVAVCH